MRPLQLFYPGSRHPPFFGTMCQAFRLAEKPPLEEILAKGSAVLPLRLMKATVKSPESAAYLRGLGIFPTETPPTEAPKHVFSLPGRIEGLGGSFELDSTPGCGSGLTVTIATAECPARRASVTS